MRSDEKGGDDLALPSTTGPVVEGLGGAFTPRFVVYYYPSLVNLVP